jgi:hypothetical protein
MGLFGALPSEARGETRAVAAIAGRSGLVDAVEAARQRGHSRPAN